MKTFETKCTKCKQENTIRIIPLINLWADIEVKCSHCKEWVTFRVCEHFPELQPTEYVPLEEPIREPVTKTKKATTTKTRTSNKITAPKDTKEDRLKLLKRIGKTQK